MMWSSSMTSPSFKYSLRSLCMKCLDVSMSRCGLTVRFNRALRGFSAIAALDRFTLLLILLIEALRPEYQRQLNILQS